LAAQQVCNGPRYTGRDPTVLGEANLDPWQTLQSLPTDPKQATGRREAFSSRPS